MRRVLPFAVFLVLSAAAMEAVRHWYFDDAFITFRIARNFASTGHWAYNAHSAGGDAATSPLWVLIVAAALRLHLPITGFSVAATIASSTVGAGLVYETLRLRGATRGGICAGVLVSGSEILAVNRGMELPLVLCLAAGSLYTFTIRRDLLTGVLLGLVVVARADMVIFVVVLGIVLLVDTYRRALIAAAGSIVVFAVWSVFALGVIGSVLPDTLTAKVDQGKSGYWGSHPYLTGLRHLYKDAPTGTGKFDAVWFALLGLLAVVGLVIGLRRPSLRPVTAALAGLGVLYVVAYGMVLNVPDYTWYYAVPGFCMLAIAGIGLGEVLSGRPGLGAGAAAIVLALVSLHNEPHTPPRFAAYVAAGDWIAEQQPSAKVADLEIGNLGWSQPRLVVVDYLGLLSKTAAVKVAQRDMTWWVGAYQPDYWVVATPNSAEDQVVLDAPWFPSVFRKVWIDSNAVVYQRMRPAPAVG